MNKYGGIVLIGLIILLAIIFGEIIEFKDTPDQGVPSYDTTYYQNQIDSIQAILDSLQSQDNTYQDTIRIKIITHEKIMDSIYDLPASEQVDIFTRYTDHENRD